MPSFGSTLVFKGKIKRDRNQNKLTRANNDKAFRVLLFVRLGWLVLENRHKTSTGERRKSFPDRLNLRQRGYTTTYIRGCGRSKLNAEQLYISDFVIADHQSWLWRHFPYLSIGKRRIPGCPIVRCLSRSSIMRRLAYLSYVWSLRAHQTGLRSDSDPAEVLHQSPSLHDCNTCQAMREMRM